MQYVLHLKATLVKKIETEAAVVRGVDNLSSAPALTALNIFNGIRLENYSPVNAIICTKKAYITQNNVHYTSMY